MNTTVKKMPILLAVILMGMMPVRAQMVDPCPQFRNPTMFYSSGSNAFTFAPNTSRS